MARLIIQSADRESLLYELVKPRVTIGRSERNDLPLNDPNASRFHAVVEATPMGYRVLDQNSRNGTFVNGRRCEDAVLINGSVVRVGDTEIRFEDNTAAWKTTSVRTRAGNRVALLEAVERRGLAEATHDLRQLSLAPPPPPALPELYEQLREAKRHAALFELISHARRLLQEAGTPLDLLDTIPRLVFSAARAERVVVMLWDEGKQCLRPGTIHLAPGEELRDTELALSQTILSTVLESRQGVLVRDAKADPALILRQSVALSGLRSAICVPMTVRERLYGLVYADNCHHPMVFDEDDLEVVSILALEAAFALDSARAREALLEQERIRQAYRRFLPEHLADHLIATPDAIRLGGARQFVTTLFADLRGFTSLAETLQPEEAVELLNDFFTEMTAIVFRYGGTLDKYLGDGLLALFGAPLPGPADALRAVQCGIAMQAGLEELCGEWQRRQRPAVRMGIGINSGEAIAGNIGSTQYMEYTVIGDTVNVAARLTQQAGPGEILLGESTWQQVRSEVPAERLQPMPLKGKREPVAVYRVSGQAAAPASAG